MNNRAIELAANLVRTACASDLIERDDAYDECQRFADLMRVAGMFVRDQHTDMKRLSERVELLERLVISLGDKLLIVAMHLGRLSERPEVRRKP